MDKEIYTDNLRRLRDAVKTKHPKNWRTNSLFILHDNAPARRSFLVKDFLAKNNVTTTLLTWRHLIFTCFLD